MVSDYKIFKETYCDEYGKWGDSSYYIKQRKKFLWMTRWKTIKHEECGWGDCYKVTTKFKSLKLAEEFVKNTLCKNEKPAGWQIEEVGTLSCNDGSDYNKCNKVNQKDWL